MLNIFKSLTNLLYGKKGQMMQYSIEINGNLEVFDIEKVAKQIDNIDFIPLQKERYDLVIKTENLENPIYKEILSIINSDEFKDELAGLGGYDLKDTGKIIAET